ncbi:MAG TPA: phospholipase D-like domain-containing protein, partial [Planctomycetota bacterium]|nr:phospholipase D-like domain-containing protein [Planctomycetota bacterium]
NPESHHAGYSNEELVARVRGPLVSQLQAVFLADRYGETRSNVDGPDIFPLHQAEGQADAQLVPSGPGYHRENTLLLILALLGAAKERVTITTPYLIPDEPLIRAMQSAVIRGVDVRVIVPRTLDQLFMSFAQKSFYGDLLEAGVRIHLYEPAFLHAKHISVDDEISLIGSSNVDIRSFALNAEISGIFYDREITATLRKIQERYLTHSVELKKEDWDRRLIHHKVFQNIARLADSIL